VLFNGIIENASITAERYSEYMKNWLPPLAILGLSSLGLACTSSHVQARLRDLFYRLAQTTDPFGELNKFFDEQLSAIQRTLDRLAEALEEQEA